MRVSTGYQFDSFAQKIQSAQARYVDAQRQVMTGRRVEIMSDDPFQAGRVLRMSSVKESLNQYNENLQTAKGWISFSEDALGEIGALLTTAYVRAVQGANSITDQEGRDAMAREIQTLQDRLIELGNTRGPNGQYLFAGQKTNVKPFTLTLTVLGYNGDDNDMHVEVGPGETMTINTHAGNLIQNAYSTLESLKGHLIGGNSGAISGIDIDAIQASQRAVGDARAEAGARLQHVASLTDHNNRRIDDFTSQISDAADIDLSEAVTNLQKAQMAYQAALQVSGQAVNLSLMDFLR